MKMLRLILLIFTLSPAPVFAYIGPGVGLGTFATLIALILGVTLLVAGFVWYPLKRILKKKRKTNTKSKSRSEIL